MNSIYFMLLMKWASLFKDGHVNPMLRADTSELEFYSPNVRLEMIAPGTDHETLIVSQIGDDVMLYHNVTLGARRFATGKRHPTIGNRVIIGAGAKILGPVNIADDARVSYNSVVIEDVKKNNDSDIFYI